MNLMQTTMWGRVCFLFDASVNNQMCVIFFFRFQDP